jgi:transcriptional regulator with XRE-family HTH domain
MRLLAGLTIRDAAQFAGLSRGGLEKIESGANLPSLESLSALCGVYGSSLGAFFRDIDAQGQRARVLRNQWPDDVAQSSEALARLDALAQLSGHADAWRLAKDLMRLREHAPESFTAMRQLIETLVPAKRAGAVARRTPSASEIEHDPRLS